MCVREGRDERGRLLPGHTANLGGRPTRKPYARLLEAAEACGADVVVFVPPRRAKADKPAPDVLPEAA